MPTLLRRGGGEPPHIPVERESNVAKLWLSPVRLATSGGFRRPELRAIERLAIDQQQTLLEAWNDFFSG
jgi:hypothetical protein